MKTIGIVGSRRRSSTEDFRKIKDAFASIYKYGDSIVSGGCPVGADRLAEIIASQYRISITVHHANWKLLGKQAGFARNGLIANDADVLIACVSEDRTGGTEDTIRKFQKRKPEAELILV